MLELNQCYNMDCMKGMAQFPDGFFDLAVVDPPYFSGPERRGLGVKRKRGGKPGDSRRFFLIPKRSPLPKWGALPPAQARPPAAAGA